jgi:NAD+ synthase (glutamine-hydrolysing)
MPFFLCGDVLDDTPLLNVAHVTHGSDFYVAGRREV